MQINTILCWVFRLMSADPRPSLCQSICLTFRPSNKSVRPSVTQFVSSSVSQAVSQLINSSIHPSTHRSESNFNLSQYKNIYCRSLNVLADCTYSVLFCRKISPGDFKRSSLSNVKFGYIVKSKSLLCHVFDFFHVFHSLFGLRYCIQLVTYLLGLFVDTNHSTRDQ